MGRWTRAARACLVAGAFLILAIPGLALLIAGVLGMVSVIALDEAPTLIFRIHHPVFAATWYLGLFLLGSLLALFGVRRQREADLVPS